MYLIQFLAMPLIIVERDQDDGQNTQSEGQGSVIDAAHIRLLARRGPNWVEVSRTESMASHRHLKCSPTDLLELLLSLLLVLGLLVLLFIPSCCFVYHLLFTCRNFIAAILFVVVDSSFFSSKESARWGTFRMPFWAHTITYSCGHDNRNKCVKRHRCVKK